MNTAACFPRLGHPTPRYSPGSFHDLPEFPESVVSDCIATGIRPVIDCIGAGRKGGAVSPKTIAFSQRKRDRGHPRTMSVYLPLGTSDSPDAGLGAMTTGLDSRRSIAAYGSATAKLPNFGSEKDFTSLRLSFLPQTEPADGVQLRGPSELPVCASP
jgi:hypothetical protein